MRDASHKHGHAERALCNGKTLAFQARDAGSIPAARSKNLFSDSLPANSLTGSLHPFDFL